MSGKSKSKAKSTDKAKSSKPEEPQAQEMPTPIETTSEPEQIKEPKPESTPTPTLEQLYQEIQTLKQLALEHSGMIVHLQHALARKRKPVTSNSKVQICDKHTGMVYPSKNNAYQSLLKAGELKSLVDKGLFGDVPEKNTFGW